MITLASDGTLSLDLTASASPIRDRIFLSLATPLGKFWQRPDVGSELYLLRRSKATTTLPAKVAATAKAALKWMLDADMLTSVDIAAEVSGVGQIKLSIWAKSATQDVAMTYWVAVPADPR
jgi:phage gp46-like protein